MLNLHWSTRDFRKWGNQTWLSCKKRVNNPLTKVYPWPLTVSLFLKSWVLSSLIALWEHENGDLFTPCADVLRNFMPYLTNYEQTEICNYKQVWYLGKMTTKKIVCNTQNPKFNNFGFDTEEGVYRTVSAHVFTVQEQTIRSIHYTKISINAAVLSL